MATATTATGSTTSTTKAVTTPVCRSKQIGNKPACCVVRQLLFASWRFFFVSVSFLPCRTFLASSVTNLVAWLPNFRFMMHTARRYGGKLEWVQSPFTATRQNQIGFYCSFLDTSRRVISRDTSGCWLLHSTRRAHDNKLRRNNHLNMGQVLGFRFYFIIFHLWLAGWCNLVWLGSGGYNFFLFLGLGAYFFSAQWPVLFWLVGGQVEGILGGQSLGKLRTNGWERQDTQPYAIGRDRLWSVWTEQRCLLLAEWIPKCKCN